MEYIFTLKYQLGDVEDMDAVIERLGEAGATTRWRALAAGPPGAGIHARGAQRRGRGRQRWTMYAAPCPTPG